MTEASSITKEEYCRRFIKHMRAAAGFERFDNGTTVEEYATECADLCWGVWDKKSSPEEDADADISYWGED